MAKLTYKNWEVVLQKKSHFTKEVMASSELSFLARTFAPNFSSRKVFSHSGSDGRDGGIKSTLATVS